MNGLVLQYGEKMSSYSYLNQIFVREHVHEFKFKFRAGRAGVVNGLK